jgi:hypothetical protein
MIGAFDFGSVHPECGSVPNVVTDGAKTAEQAQRGLLWVNSGRDTERAITPTLQSGYCRMSLDDWFGRRPMHRSIYAGGG